jgi:hypothetical protein
MIMRLDGISQERGESLCAEYKIVHCGGESDRETTQQLVQFLSDMKSRVEREFQYNIIWV